MRREMKNTLLFIALVLVLAVAAVIVAHNAKAEALPSPDAASMLALSGNLRLSDAPMDIYVADCFRVDVVSAETDGVWADLTLPYVPPSIWGVALFDGYHMIHGVWTQAGDTLRLFFWPDDLARLDGTVGLYLLIVTEGEWQTND